MVARVQKKPINHFNLDPGNVVIVICPNSHCNACFHGPYSLIDHVASENISETWHAINVLNNKHEAITILPGSLGSIDLDGGWGVLRLD